MACYVEAGSGFVGSVAVIHGAGRDMIRFHRAAFRTTKQHGSFVNSRSAAVYGPTSLDCRFSLCRRVDRMAILHGVACASGGAETSRCDGVPVSG